MATVSILVPQSGQKPLEMRELKGWPWTIPRLGEIPESQRREWDCKRLQGYKAFEEATVGLTDIIPVSEIIIV